MPLPNQHSDQPASSSEKEYFLLKRNAVGPEKNQSRFAPKVDVERCRSLAVVGYLVPFLFFLPLVDQKTNRAHFSRFHANQQLILLIVLLGSFLLHNLLFVFLLSFGSFISKLLSFIIVILMAIGAYNAYHNRYKPLPVIGSLQIIPVRREEESDSEADSR